VVDWIHRCETHRSGGLHTHSFTPVPQRQPHTQHIEYELALLSNLLILLHSLPSWIEFSSIQLPKPETWKPSAVPPFHLLTNYWSSSLISIAITQLTHSLSFLPLACTGAFYTKDSFISKITAGGNIYLLNIIQEQSALNWSLFSIPSSSSRLLEWSF
jgi:hypothetical protein